MVPEDEYYDKRMETLSRSELKRLQLKKIKKVVSYAYYNCPFYRKRWRALSIGPSDINSLDDFRKKIPTFKKDDIRKEIESTHDFTAGLASCDLKSVGNIALTSGTTGINTFVVFSRSFLYRFVERVALREFWMEKLRPRMKVLTNLSSFHFLGMAKNYMLKRLGAICLAYRGTYHQRFSDDFVNTMTKLQPDYIFTTLSFLLTCIENAHKKGLELRKIFKNVKYISVAGEPITPTARRRLLSELPILDIFESGGSVDGLWGGGECFVHNGHHVWMDWNYMEVIDPKTGEPIEEGRGACVNTNLMLGSSLFIRFNCEDLVEVYQDICECGRTHVRVEIFDRISNVINVRGKAITPTDVLPYFESFPETADGRFTIVSSSGLMDKLKIKACHSEDVKDPDLLREELEAKIKKGLGVEAEIVWVKPTDLPYVYGKIQRIIQE